MGDNGEFESDMREESVQDVPESVVDNGAVPQAEKVVYQSGHRRNSRLFGRVREGLGVVGQAVKKVPLRDRNIGDRPIVADRLDVVEDTEMPSARDETHEAAIWSRRRDIPLSILAWAGVAFLTFWIAEHFSRALLLLAIAALFAYALAPAVTFFQRYMPRFVATLLVYLVVLVGACVLFYFIIRTAVDQVTSLAAYVGRMLDSKNGISPLEHTLESFGLTSAQIGGMRDQLIQQTTSVGGDLSSFLTFLSGFFNVILDVILVAILSIYLLADGTRVVTWLSSNTPITQRSRVRFLLKTLQRIVGGYIRGQILLCSLIGVLVGAGMAVIGVPYALLLGVLAFVLEFIPVLGTLVSGAICVLLALTNGWVQALIVLVYFVVVHIIEGDIVGPRIVGRAIGLHPIVSLAALVAGADLFGVWGALFASPIAGVIQAFIVALWSEWRATHPHQFQYTREVVGAKLEQNVADRPVEAHEEEKLLS